MSTKKKDLAKLDAFITQGHAELAQLRPEQRGIHNPNAISPEESLKEYRELSSLKSVKESSATRARFTVNLNPRLIDWARRAVVFTPGQSLAGLVSDALERELERIEKERGEAFPKTLASPKKGRPIKL